MARGWTDAYLETLGQLLERAGSARPREDSVLLLAAANGLLLEQLASGRDSNLRPHLRWVAFALLRA